MSRPSQPTRTSGRKRLSSFSPLYPDSDSEAEYDADWNFDPNAPSPKPQLRVCQNHIRSYMSSVYKGVQYELDDLEDPEARAAARRMSDRKAMRKFIARAVAKHRDDPLRPVSDWRIPKFERYFAELKGFHTVPSYSRAHDSLKLTVLR